MRVKVFANFEEALDPIIEVEQRVEVIIDYLIPEELPKLIPENTVRFVVNIQPEGQFNDLIRKYHDHYDHLLTFIPELLILPKARFFIGLTPFCTPGITHKIFGVSAVFSGRNCLPGHKLRFELWKRRHEIKIPQFFYIGDRSPFPYPIEDGIKLSAVKGAKNEVMKTMFHIAIDSFDYNNSFSEKLIDPIITGSIPIYWGAKNANQYFPEGVIFCNDVDEIIEVCNAISEDFDLEAWQDSIELNYYTALQFTDYGAQLQKKIKEVLNENT